MKQSLHWPLPMRFACFCLGGAPRGEGGEASKPSNTKQLEEPSVAARFPSLYQAAYNGSVEAVQAHLAAGAAPESHMNELDYTP